VRKLEEFSVKILKVGGEMFERWETESVLLVQKKDLRIWFNLLLVLDNEIQSSGSSLGKIWLKRMSSAGRSSIETDEVAS